MLPLYRYHLSRACWRPRLFELNNALGGYGADRCAPDWLIGRRLAAVSGLFSHCPALPLRVSFPVVRGVSTNKTKQRLRGAPASRANLTVLT